MKLFDVFQQNKMVDLFQERAVAFRLQFSSEALWQQVQGLGLQIDASNPLYQSVDSTPDFSVFPLAESGVNEITDSNLAEALYNDVGITAKPVVSDKSGLASEDDFNFEIDFAPLQDISATDEATDEEAIFASIPDSFSLSEKTQTVVATDAVSTAHNAVAAPVKPVIDADDFVSDDETLQSIAKLISNGHRKEAFETLEVLLYKGTMPQRLTASKWLDKLLSKYGKI